MPPLFWCPMAKNIVWLASYPKSGNTWLRLVLFNYLFDNEKPAPINQAHRIGPGDAVSMLYRKLAKKPADLMNLETSLALRPRVIAAHSANGADVNFMKTHNANIELQGQKLIPKALTRAAIYVIRNPLDMVVSFAHHYNSGVEEIAEAIGNENHTITPDDSVVHQFIGNWSEHVRSWTNAKGFKVAVLRYEDMTNDPVTAFGSALNFIGAPPNAERLEKAIRFSSFDEAKKQEQTYGFVERPANSKAFFRSGKVGEGRETLPQSAIDRIIADHGPTMKKYGYLE